MTTDVQNLVAGQWVGDPQNERVQRGIHISINGIAAGLRNTG